MDFFFKRRNPIEAQMAARNAAIRACTALKDQGTVTQTIEPNVAGRVLFQATTWFAICPYKTVLLPNTYVRVIGQYNATTLIVEPVAPVNPQNPAIEQVS